jgi:MEMO1 family protein
VLEAPESVSSLQDLDPKVYGVITTCGWRRGLLLPDLEGVDTCEDQVAIAMSKGGIRSGEPISLERFKVVRYA